MCLCRISAGNSPDLKQKMKFNTCYLKAEHCEGIPQILKIANLGYKRLSMKIVLYFVYSSTIVLGIFSSLYVISRGVLCVIFHRNRKPDLKVHVTCHMFLLVYEDTVCVLRMCEVI